MVSAHSKQLLKDATDIIFTQNMERAASSNVEERQENEKVLNLTMMMGDGVDGEVARKVLRKHKGDVEKAADAILNGDRGEDTTWNTPPTPQGSAYLGLPPNLQGPPPPSSSVIDLTSDDDDMNRAIEMSISMDTPPAEPKFGPSERAPNPAWQMVPSNVATSQNITQEDQSLNEAIQASLNEFNTEDTDDQSLEEILRVDGRPVALRPDVPSFVYAALVTHALFHVPQFRRSVAKLYPPDTQPDEFQSSDDRILNLVYLFAKLDLSQKSAIFDDVLLPSLKPPYPKSLNDPMPDLSADFAKEMGTLIEQHLDGQRAQNEPGSRLFNFTHGQVQVVKDHLRFKRNDSEGNLVALDFGGEGNTSSDLISCLAKHLSHYEEDKATSLHDVILEPSDLVGFQIKRNQGQKSVAKSFPEQLVYPKTIFLDQFLKRNIELANQKRATERAILTEIENLKRQRDNLTQFNSRDTLRDLRSVIHYYENVAEAKGGHEREYGIPQTTAKLKKILASICRKVEEIDATVNSLQTDVTAVFDCPELQQYRYDLRAVLFHTGLPGRKQLYSYVQDSAGVWWKTVDFLVTEVPEEIVLNDQSGLHMNAGPYLLLYSKHLSREDLKTPIIWPKLVADMIQGENNEFILSLPPEAVSGETLSPPTATFNPLLADPAARQRSGSQLDTVGASSSSI